MRRLFLVLLTILVFLIPSKPVSARPLEISSVQITAHQQIASLPQPALEPLPEAGLLVTPVSNPSLGGNSYEEGQCVWGVAIWREQLGHPVPAGLGDAADWAVNAANAGLPVSTVPEVGDVAQTSRGSLGHVALVIAVDDNRVMIREMNARYIPFEVDERWVAASDYIYIGI